VCDLVHAIRGVGLGMMEELGKKSWPFKTLYKKQCFRMVRLVSRVARLQIQHTQPIFIANTQPGLIRTQFVANLCTDSIASMSFTR